jgi:hypothetical protein
MTVRTHASAVLACCLLVAFPQPLFGQWSLTGGIRAPRFSGGAVELETGTSLRPYRPTVFEIGVEKAGRRVGIGLRLHYASSSLALEGSDVVAAVKDALSVYGAEPEVSLRLSQVGDDGVLRLYAGPLLELWKLGSDVSHTRVGVSAGVGLEVPIGGRWSGAVRAGVAVTPRSPFTEAELDPTFEPRALWRRELEGGVRFRL